MSHICLTYASHMPHICLSYASHTSLICLSYASHTSLICLAYVNVSKRRAMKKKRNSSSRLASDSSALVPVQQPPAPRRRRASLLTPVRLPHPRSRRLHFLIKVSMIVHILFKGNINATFQHREALEGWLLGHATFQHVGALEMRSLERGLLGRVAWGASRGEVRVDGLAVRNGIPEMCHVRRRIHAYDILGGRYMHVCGCAWSGRWHT